MNKKPQSISNYLKVYPDATLKEYEEYYKEVKREEKASKEEKRATEAKILKDLEGKYVFVRFSTTSTIIVHIDSKITSNKMFHCMNIYCGSRDYSSGTSIKLGYDSRILNPYWFFSDSHEIGIRKWEIITEDDYNKFDKLLQSQIKDVKNIIDSVCI